jgi:DNA-directed RNA polymerase II subunit RPB1
LVDTGINTSRTGYAYRRIIKGIENQRVALDGSVRDGQYLVQRVYGGTGANPEWFETVTVKTMCCSKEELRAKAVDMYVLKPPDDGEEFGLAELAQIDQMGAAWYRAAVCVKEFSLNPFVHDSNTPVKSEAELKTIVVVPFERILAKYAVSKVVDMERFTVCYDYDERRELESMLAGPDECMTHAFDLFLRLDRDLAEQGGAGASAPNRLHMWEAVTAFVTSQLANKADDWDTYAAAMARVVRALVYTYADARTRWIRSRIEPGEQCGILAAQSIGEPTTQMTMNTHHNVGRGSENLQMGVPRMTEILDMTVKMKTPVMVVFPQPSVDVDTLGAMFKGATLTSLLTQVEVIRDLPANQAGGELTCVPEDKEWMALNRAYFGPDCDDEDVPLEEGKYVVASTRDYVIRYELDADKVHASKVDIVEIASKLREAWAARPENTWESIFVTFTPVPIGSGVYVVRLRCTGVRCIAMEEPTQSQRAATQRYLGSFLRRLALYS